MSFNLWLELVADDYIVDIRFSTEPRSVYLEHGGRLSIARSWP